MSPQPNPPPGIVLPNGTTITHGSGATIKSPFSHLPTPIPVTMHELSPGIPSSRSFAGQFGFIDFDTSIRLPRHVHIAPVSTNPSPIAEGEGEGETEQHFTSERILVLNGVAMVELKGEVYVIPPRTLVTIPGGLPHTWTAAPKGVRISTPPPSTSSVLVEADGTFLMVYEYEEVTGFYPTRQRETLKGTSEYVRCDDLDEIRFPALSKEQVGERGWFVWDKEVSKGRRS